MNRNRKRDGGSCRAAGVAVVQAADHWHADYGTKVTRLHVAVLRAVAVQPICVREPW